LTQDVGHTDVDAADGFQPEDVLRQAQIQDIAIAPDGSAVVYSRRVIEDGT